MPNLVIAEHDNASIKAATLNTIAAAQKIGGDIHVLVAGECAQAAADAFMESRPKRTVSKISIEEQKADLKALDEGKMSLTEFKAKYEGADLGSTDIGVGT